MHSKLHSQTSSTAICLCLQFGLRFFFSREHTILCDFYGNSSFAMGKIICTRPKKNFLNRVCYLTITQCCPGLKCNDIVLPLILPLLDRIESKAIRFISDPSLTLTLCLLAARWLPFLFSTAITLVTALMN